MKKTYTKRQIREAMAYWENALMEMNETAQRKLAKRAYLDSALPKNGITLYDDAGKKLDFGFSLSKGMAAGWTGVDKDGNAVCLCDAKSGYDGHDVSIPMPSKFLADRGYELVDER